MGGIGSSVIGVGDPDARVIKPGYGDVADGNVGTLGGSLRSPEVTRGSAAIGVGQGHVADGDGNPIGIAGQAELDITAGISLTGHGAIGECDEMP